MSVPLFIRCCTNSDKRWHCAHHEDIWEEEVQLDLILTSALDEREWSASCPSCFTPGKRAPQYLLNRRSNGPQRWLGNLAEEKISCPCWEMKKVLWSTSVWPAYTLYRLCNPACSLYIHYTDSAIQPVVCIYTILTMPSSSVPNSHSNVKQWHNTVTLISDHNTHIY